jgi:hypothetical protein
MSKRIRKHMHHNNGGAARDWNVLSIRPPLSVCHSVLQSAIKNRKSQIRNRYGIFSTTRHHRHYARAALEG